MDKINNINSIVSILRNQISKQQVKTAKNKNSTKPNDDVKVNRKEPVSQSALIDTIQSRISKAKANKSSENYREVVMKIIAESIITNEFGTDIVNDTEFDNLINNVVDGYISESSILKKIDNIITKTS